MRVLFLGDVVGRSGRTAVCAALPDLRAALRLDAVIVNGENAAHGFGLTAKIYAQFIEAGADVVTTGNHVFDQRDMLTEINGLPRLLRPINYPPGAPGRGAVTVTLSDGRRLVVINVLGRLFMEAVDDPLRAVAGELAKTPRGAGAQAIVLDFHAEATSEKQAFGHFFSEQASLIVGTHTHTPSADTRILPGGAAYQTDAGMCGDYAGVIGFQPEAPVHRFLRHIPGPKLQPMDGPATLCGVFLETDDKTGAALVARPFRHGPGLIATPFSDFS